MNADITMHENRLRESLNGLVQSLNTLIDEDITFQTLDTALDCYTSFVDQFSDFDIDAPAIEALERIERFIIAHAPAIYNAAQATPQQRSTILDRFAKHLLTMDGIGPATAKKLFEANIALPEQLHELSREEVAKLPLPPASLARVSALHAERVNRC